MISIELSPEIEKKFTEIVHESFNGDLQKAITTLMELHQKYGWKDQLLQEVKSVRSEVTRQGGISAKTVDNEIKNIERVLPVTDLLRVVIETNHIISAILSSKGASAKLIDWMTKDEDYFVLLISEPIWKEYATVAEWFDS